MFFLELPTGGLADAVGRHRVALVSMVVSAAALALFVVAHSFAALVAVCALLGIHRALGSGPLEAWYVDTVHATDPHARLEKGLSAQGTVVGISMAAGAAVTPMLSRRIGVASVAGLMRILQGLTAAIMGLTVGLAGIIGAYVACYVVHGTSNAAHMTLLHRQAASSVRATVVSLNSWISQPSFAAGAIVLTALAERTSVSAAILTGAVVLAVAAPLYLPAWRQSRVDRGRRRVELGPQPSDELAAL